MPKVSLCHPESVLVVVQDTFFMTFSRTCLGITFVFLINVAKYIHINFRVSVYPDEYSNYHFD